MSNFHHLANRVLNTPLFLEPAYARTLFGALSPRLNIQSLTDIDGEVLSAEKLRVKAESWGSDRERNRPYQLIDGVAVLSVTGSLVHKHGYLQPYSGMTGYDGLIARLQAAVADDEVKGIMLDIDSPGGEVTGCFDCVDQIVALRGQKPIWALCYDMACSAAMAIASAADRRLITQTGVAGSVGVIMAHASYEKAIQEQGVNVTLIYSGKHKADGNPYNDLPKDVLARFQSQTDALRHEFAAKVAANIGLSVEAVLATEASTFRGQQAIDIGFADQLVNGNTAISEFIDYLAAQARNPTTGVTMTTENQPNPAAQGPDLTQQLNSARANERARISGILQHAEADGRKTMAEHLAFNTDMSVEQAGTLLAVSGKEQAPAAAPAAPEPDANTATQTALDRAMAQTAQPNVGADSGGNTEPSMVDQVLNAHASLTGAKHVE